ncbi:hypothetical protein QTP88_021960 [Uroleucon formosanum]
MSKTLPTPVTRLTAKMSRLVFNKLWITHRLLIYPAPHLTIAPYLHKLQLRRGLRLSIWM